MITIHNNGPLITSTNYFESEQASNGFIYASVNDRAFRLLIPANAPQPEAAGSKYIIVTRGKWPNKQWKDCLEFVWEDNSQSPYHAIIETQMVDRLPLPEDAGRTDLRCIGYDPSLTVLFDLPARYRTVPRVPYLKPWKT